MKTIRYSVFFSLLFLSLDAYSQTYEEKVAASRALLGQPVQSHTFYTADKRAIGFEALNGKPAVLYFFATWCSPCYETLENLESARTAVGPAVNVIAVSLVDSWKKLNRMLDKTGYTGTVWRSAGGKAVLHERSFANYGASVPYAIKIDKHGVLAEQSYQIKTKKQWAASLRGNVSLSNAARL